MTTIDTHTSHGHRQDHRMGEHVAHLRLAARELPDLSIEEHEGSGGSAQAFDPPFSDRRPLAGRPGRPAARASSASLPLTATIQPAPVYGRSSRIGNVKPSGAPAERRVVREGEVRLGDADREVGEPERSRAARPARRPRARARSSRLRRGAWRSLRAWPESTPRAGRGSECGSGRSAASTTASASPIAPVPPRSKPSLISAANGPASSASPRTAASSSSSSPGNRFTATTQVSAELAHDRDVRGQVLGAPLDRREPALRIAAVVLQRLRRRDEHDGARREAAEAADDVDELLEAHVGAEAALGDDVVAQLEAEPVADQRAVAVRDVGERAAVDERRLPLERLDEVRLQRVGQQRGHRAGGAELLRRHGLAFEGRARP